MTHDQWNVPADAGEVRDRLRKIPTPALPGAMRDIAAHAEVRSDEVFDLIDAPDEADAHTCEAIAYGIVAHEQGWDMPTEGE